MARSSLKKHCQDFLDFSLEGKKVSIPYWSNKLKDGKIIVEGRFGGKGTLAQIKKATKEAAKKEKLDLKKLTSQEIFYLMKRNKIGIDCSGLVYQLLSLWSKEEKGLNLDKILIGSQGKKGVRRIGVKQLTDPQNSISIQLKDLKPGDLIVVDQEKHVLLVLDVKGKEITYIHSSQKTKERGVHLGTLKIISPNKDLSQQEWSDKLKDNRPYNEIIHKNDGLYRLKA